MTGEGKRNITEWHYLTRKPKVPLHYYAGTQGSASTPLAASQIVTGTDAQMSANMVNSFTTILENGVQIALIKQPCMLSLPSLWML